MMCATICDKSHIHTYSICKAWKWDDKFYWNQVPDSHPHVDWGICKREDKRQDWMWIQNSPQKDELLRRLSTADGLTPMSLLPTEIWAQLYNPLHPKVQAFICWLQNCGVVQSLNMSSQSCYADAFLIIYRKEITEPEHNIVMMLFFAFCSLSMRQILTVICEVLQYYLKLYFTNGSLQVGWVQTRWIQAAALLYSNKMYLRCFSDQIEFHFLQLKVSSSCLSDEALRKLNQKD